MGHALGHSHASGHAHHHAHGGKSLGRAFFLNAGFAVIELVGGLLTQSVAILSDALHDLGDSISLGMAWWAERTAAHRPPDDQWTYGYQRLTVFSALINAVILAAGSLFIISEAVPRFWNPVEPNSLGMAGLAVLGVAVNGFAAWGARRETSTNARVVLLHLLEDALGWMAVLIGAVVIHCTGWFFVDPLLAIGISAFILFNVFRNLRPIVDPLLQRAPPDVDVEAIRRRLEQTPAIESIHHLHLWSLDGNRHVLTVHVVLPRQASATTYREAKQVVRAVAREHQLAHVTAEVEYANEPCDMRGNPSGEAGTAVNRE